MVGHLGHSLLAQVGGADGMGGFSLHGPTEPGRAGGAGIGQISAARDVLSCPSSDAVRRGWAIRVGPRADPDESTMKGMAAAFTG
jgi:hypothetical protein